jgi:hypothetical protein
MVIAGPLRARATPKTAMQSYRQPYLRAAEVQIRRVWETLRASGPLAAEEQRLASILIAHPEWQRTWDGKDHVPAAAEADPERNPFLHIHLHEMIERQAAERKPAVIADYLDAAADRPERRHIRIHRILPILWFTLADALRDGNPVDMKVYEQRLRGLRVTTRAVTRQPPGNAP